MKNEAARSREQIQIVRRAKLTELYKGEAFRFEQELQRMGLAIRRARD